MSDYIRLDFGNRRRGTRQGILHHRIVMEMALGRPLSLDELVHHKDGNKRNNNISNLEIVSRSDHMKIHKIRKHGVSQNSNPCLATDCTHPSFAIHGLCHKHGTIQGMWARKRGHKVGWNIEKWIELYRPRIPRKCNVPKCKNMTASGSGVCRKHHNNFRWWWK